MGFRKLPLYLWRHFVRRLARAHGFIDPFSLLAQLERFAQPAEVAFPIELLRAGALFHARGLLNTKVIQHNRDWVWPFWVEQQFNPESVSFVPRAFSATHVNLTQRNWTAVGAPDSDHYVIIDPRGLVTPFWDGWSIDFWLIGPDGTLLPSRAGHCVQELNVGSSLFVKTAITSEVGELRSQAEVIHDDGDLHCVLSVEAQSSLDAHLVVSLRPYNPEGVSFLHHIEFDRKRNVFEANRKSALFFDTAPDTIFFSDYREGDVFAAIAGKGPNRDSAHQKIAQEKIDCAAGLATGAALFPVVRGSARQLTVRVPLLNGDATHRHSSPATWRDALSATTKLSIPDERMKFLFDAAVSSLVLFSATEIFPGPYTYKRFWFRDAAFISEALLAVGLSPRAEKAINLFPGRQTSGGYFLSQEGEWDSNGAALWAIRRFCEVTGEKPHPEWKKAILDGAEWIRKKRTRADGALHNGLLPAGFSAEHLGVNDFYYWDDFFSVAGLQAGAWLAGELGEKKRAEEFRAEASDLLQAIDLSLRRSAHRHGDSVPASPYRRLDAGAIGSLAASYPLHLWKPEDPRLLRTAEFLFKNCLVKGGFFQDMIHSGINPYLTLHLAQVFLRAGDKRFFELVKTVADLASPTGQWPEGIHPLTLGGCMGDGQHAWAAAEWILMLRNMFVREEGDSLFVAFGIPAEWLRAGAELSLGPAPTRFGPVSVTIRANGSSSDVSVQGDWRGQPPRIEVPPEGFRQVR